MNRKIFISVILLVTVVTAFVVADYFSLFGVEKIEKTDFIELNFKTIDEETGAPVSNVKTRCFQKKNNNACTQRQSNELNIVSINIPVQRIIMKSILFERNEGIVDTADPKLHIMFIHKDYANPVETLYIEDMSELKGGNITVKMPKSIRNQ